MAVFNEQIERSRPPRRQRIEEQIVAVGSGPIGNCHTRLVRRYQTTYPDQREGSAHQQTCPAKGPSSVVHRLFYLVILYHGTSRLVAAIIIVRFLRRRLCLRIMIAPRLWRTIFVGSAVYDWLEVKVAVPRRAGRRPLQRVGSPRIPSNRLAEEYAADEIPSEDYLNCNHRDRADRHELVHWQQMFERVVMVWVRQPSGKSNDAQNMHGKKCAIEEDKRKKEVNLA